MANTFLTPEVVAKEALMVLTSNLVMADLVHRDYSEEFVSVGDTVSIRKPAKFVAKNFTGTAETQDITEGSVSVKLDRFRDVTVAVSSKQLSLDIADFSSQVVEPAMQAIAQAIDQDLLAVAVASAAMEKSGDPKAADLHDIAELAKHLDMAKAPVANRALVMHPEHKYRYALTENLSNASYAGDNETLRDALLGKVYTLDTYMDQNAPASAAATPGTATAFTISGSKGDTSVTASNVEGTIVAGDGFILDGYFYRFTQGGTGKLGIDQKLMGDYEGAEVTVVNAPTKALAQQTDVILLDEPTAVLDYGSKVSVMRLLRQLAHEQGKAVLLSTHDLEIAFQTADEVWILQQNGLQTGTLDALEQRRAVSEFLAQSGLRYEADNRRIVIGEDKAPPLPLPSRGDSVTMIS